MKKTLYINPETKVVYNAKGIQVFPVQQVATAPVSLDGLVKLKDYNKEHAKVGDAITIVKLDSGTSPFMANLLFTENKIHQMLYDGFIITEDMCAFMHGSYVITNTQGE